MHKSKKATFALIALLLPSVAFANAGVPMLFLAMPVFIVSLIPIIAIESFYLSRSLELTIKQSFKNTI